MKLLSKVAEISKMIMSPFSLLWFRNKTLLMISVFVLSDLYKYFEFNRGSKFVNTLPPSPKQNHHCVPGTFR